MRYLCMLFLVFGLLSCDSNLVQIDHQEFAQGAWPIQEAAQFDIQPVDTTRTYDLFLHLRNTRDYPYSNIYLITAMKFPHGKIVTDTLEYAMTTPQGAFIGSASGAVVENKLWYREGFRFRESGTYQLTIQHAMRDPRSVDGVPELEGVLDIGYSIEKPLKDGEN